MGQEAGKRCQNNFKLKEINGVFPYFMDKNVSHSQKSTTLFVTMNFHFHPYFRYKYKLYGYLVLHISYDKIYKKTTENCYLVRILFEIPKILDIFMFFKDINIYIIQFHIFSYL